MDASQSRVDLLLLSCFNSTEASQNSKHEDDHSNTEDPLHDALVLLSSRVFDDVLGQEVVDLDSYNQDSC